MFADGVEEVKEVKIEDVPAPEINVDFIVLCYADNKRELVNPRCSNINLINWVRSKIFADQHMEAHNTDDDEADDDCDMSLPAAPIGVTVTELQNGLLIKWIAPYFYKRRPMPDYYTVHYRSHQHQKWMELPNEVHGETFYFWDDPMFGPTYQFRVFSHAEVRVKPTVVSDEKTEPHAEEDTTDNNVVSTNNNAVGEENKKEDRKESVQGRKSLSTGAKSVGEVRESASERKSSLVQPTVEETTVTVVVTSKPSQMAVKETTAKYLDLCSRYGKPCLLWKLPKLENVAHLFVNREIYIPLIGKSTTDDNLDEMTRFVPYLIDDHEFYATARKASEVHHRTRKSRLMKHKKIEEVSPAPPPPAPADKSDKKKKGTDKSTKR